VEEGKVGGTTLGDWAPARPLKVRQPNKTVNVLTSPLGGVNTHYPEKREKSFTRITKLGEQGGVSG